MINICMCACSVFHFFMTLCGYIEPVGLLCPQDVAGINTGVGCHFLPQWILPTQGSHPYVIWTPGLGGRFFYHQVIWEAPTICIKIHSKRSENTQMGVLRRKGMKQTLWYALNYYVCMIFIITIYIITMYICI